MECNKWAIFVLVSRKAGYQVFDFRRIFKATVLLVEKEFLMDNIPDQRWSINAQLHFPGIPGKNSVSRTQDKEENPDQFQQARTNAFWKQVTAFTKKP